MDANNLFPKDLKRGILSEDFLYNLLFEIEQIKKEMEHEYLYRCGVIDAFNEVVKAGVKDLALSHPASLDEIKELLPYAKIITEKYGTKYEVEKNLLITDLFPYSANKGKTVILFYKKDEIIQTYHALKKQKEKSLKYGTYEKERENIARDFGKLLSYSDDSINIYLKTNTEKE